MPDPQLLGALYAILAVLALLTLTVAIVAGSVWAWLRGHTFGEIRWDRYSFAVRLDNPSTRAEEKAHADPS